MKKLVVLEHSKNKVHFFDIDDNADDDILSRMYPDIEPTHSLCARDVEIVFHKKVLRKENENEQG